MGKDRARKRMIRARMAATGEPYTVARRALGEGRDGYWRDSWQRSGWTRLLPVEAMFLEIAITTATVHEGRSSLHAALASSPARRDLPEGGQTRLSWGSSDDDEATTAIVGAARDAFTAALAELGIAVPKTVLELADVLAALGVYERSEERGVQPSWRSPEDLVDPLDVLPLPDSWREHEDNVRWRTITGLPADNLIQLLRHADKPTKFDTSVEHLARAVGWEQEQIRLAIDGLLYCGWATTHRLDQPLSRRGLAKLAPHARFSLEIDWDSAGQEHGPDLSAIRWMNSPWATYLNLATDNRLDPGTLRVAGELYFEAAKPTGGRILTSLGELAATLGSSIERAARALSSLDEAGWVTWDGEEQLARLESAPRPGAPGTSSTASVDQLQLAVEALGAGGR